MHLKIRHRTEYRYETPVRYSIQELHLTPPSTAGQKVGKWKIATPIKATNSIDSFGNLCSVFVQESPYTSMMIEAEGDVQTQDAFEFSDDENAVSPYYLLQQTNLTEPTTEMLEYFSSKLPKKNTIDQVLKLAEAVRESITYSPGQTNFATTAAQSFAMKSGVCQDHAHVMLSLCRAAQIPARYVSGYFFAEESPNLASHAWIDVWVDEMDYAGWISIDVTHACFQNDRYCRLAVGRDYESAAPIRGIRRGGGTESMSVKVEVRDIER